MSQRLVSFFSSNPSIGTNTRTPLSARWAQMSHQERIIEKKRLEVLEKMEAQKKNKGKFGDLSKPPPTVNKFSNDGSFMDQFKKISQGKKLDTPIDIKSQSKDEGKCVDNIERNDNRKNYQDNKDRDRKEREWSREKEKDREREQERGRDREREDRKDGRKSSNRAGQGRSRSPRRRETRDDRQDHNRDNRSKRWDSVNDHYTGFRRRSPSPPPEEHRRRKSRFSSPEPTPPPLSSNVSDMPINRSPFISNPSFKPPSMTEPPFNNTPPNNQAFSAPPMNNQSYNIPPTNTSDQMNSQPFYNNFSMHGNVPNNINFMMPPNVQNSRPPFGPPNPMNFPNPAIPPPCNSLIPPPFTKNSSFPQMPPGNQQHNMPLNNRNASHSNMPLPPNFIPPPGVRPLSIIPPPLSHNTASLPPPRMSGPAPSLLYPPGINIPLHNIPEPKPLDTMSIPPPKPLDTLKIPPPAPLDAVKIPPPGPMNLHKIPPPMPICLTQIPKPKELDLCAIPPPITGNVLSTDNRRTRPVMEEIASQVARSGQDLENMLIAQSAQDPSLWFLRDRNCSEYKTYREMVNMFRERNCGIEDYVKNKFGSEDESKYVPDEDKYEPEYCLQDDSSDEVKYKPDYGTIKFEKGENNFSKRDKYMKSDSDGDNNLAESREKRRRKRKSRWGDSSESVAPVVAAPGIVNVTSLGGVVPVVPAPIPPPGPSLPISGEKPQLIRVTRQDPGLLQYALKSFGSTNLSEEDWSKCEEHYKISLLYQEMLKKRRELDNLAAKGHHKYEYDSDEETEGGTWEHKLRQQEMEATSKWSTELNKAAHGKHHIGDFLPPEELKKFMDKYSAVKTGKEPDLSDYKEYKLKEDNIGFKMLQKLGWTEGEGLGADGSGIVNPVNKGASREMNQGLGLDTADMIDEGDDEFDTYRKRMMLAYRFRPNPMNNPRRPYY